MSGLKLTQTIFENRQHRQRLEVGQNRLHGGSERKRSMSAMAAMPEVQQSRRFQPFIPPRPPNRRVSAQAVPARRHCVRCQPPADFRASGCSAEPLDVDAREPGAYWRGGGAASSSASSAGAKRRCAS